MDRTTQDGDHPLLLGAGNGALKPERGRGVEFICGCRAIVHEGLIHWRTRYAMAMARRSTLCLKVRTGKNPIHQGRTLRVSTAPADMAVLAPRRAALSHSG